MKTNTHTFTSEASSRTVLYQGVRLDYWLPDIDGDELQTSSLSLARKLSMSQVWPWVFRLKVPKGQLSEPRMRNVTAAYRGHRVTIKAANHVGFFVSTADPVIGRTTGLYRPDVDSWAQWVPRSAISDIAVEEKVLQDLHVHHSAPSTPERMLSSYYARYKGIEVKAGLGIGYISLSTKDAAVAQELEFSYVERAQTWHKIVTENDVDDFYHVDFFGDYQGHTLYLQSETEDSYFLLDRWGTAGREFRMDFFDRNHWQLWVFKDEVTNVRRVQYPLGLKDPPFQPKPPRGFTPSQGIFLWQTTSDERSITIGPRALWGVQEVGGVSRFYSFAYGSTPDEAIDKLAENMAIPRRFFWHHQECQCPQCTRG